jgi:hypothetical protein
VKKIPSTVDGLARDRAPEPRDPPRERAELAPARGDEPPDAPHGDERVHHHVPREQREERECEDVDALRGSQLIGGDPERERDDRERRHDPRPPGDRAERAGEGRMPGPQALERERRAARDERVGRSVAAGDLARRARGPSPVLVGPDSTAGVGGLDRPDEHGFARGGFVHSSSSMFRGQLLWSSRESARSASTRPPVWHRAQ